MSVYVSTTYFGDGSRVDDALKDLEKLNIKNIELGSNHSPSAKKIKFSRSSNYIVHNYFPPKEKKFILNIASTSPKIREKSINFIKNSITWCQKNNIKYYTIHPGFFAEVTSPIGYGGKNRNFDLKFNKESISNKNRKKIIEGTANVIRQLYSFANDKTQLLIENQGSITSAGFTLFDSYYELRQLKRFVGEQLKFNLNLAHALLSRAGIERNKIFLEFYKGAPFFEVSEIRGIYDSHLPLQPGNGKVLKLLKNFKDLFKKRNIILEYRNIKGEKLLKSYRFVSEILA